MAESQKKLTVVVQSPILPSYWPDRRREVCKNSNWPLLSRCRAAAESDLVIQEHQQMGTDKRRVFDAVFTAVIVKPPDVDDSLLLFALEQSHAIQDLFGQRATSRIPIFVVATKQNVNRADHRRRISCFLPVECLTRSLFLIFGQSWLDNVDSDVGSISQIDCRAGSSFQARCSRW